MIYLIVQSPSFLSYFHTTPSEWSEKFVFQFGYSDFGVDYTIHSLRKIQLIWIQTVNPNQTNPK